jgi:hypothetical protein
MSPAMVAAAAVTGEVTDVRRLLDSDPDAGSPARADTDTEGTGEVAD